MLSSVSSMNRRIRTMGESSIEIDRRCEIWDIVFRMRLTMALETVTRSEKDQDRQEGIQVCRSDEREHEQQNDMNSNGEVRRCQKQDDVGEGQGIESRRQLVEPVERMDVHGIDSEA